MKRHILWTIEFLSITAIGIIPTYFKTYWYLIVIPIFIIVILKYIEFRLDKNEKLGKVKLQIDLLWRLMEFKTVDKVRCTYHLPKKKKYMQLFDYVPNGEGKGRRFGLSKGLVSKCFEEKGLVIESFASDEEYRNKMISTYNYSTSEMRQRSADKRSYLCYPLVDSYSAKVVGVLFFDSVNPDVFSKDEHDPRNKILKEVAASIYDTLK